MSYGYSLSLVAANKSASAKSLGVALGRVCIPAGISAKQLAETFGVSRMTIYNWFQGASRPHPRLAPSVAEYIEELKKK
jgi:DNA-binding XRE family transcriptional regulator